MLELTAFSVVTFSLALAGGLFWSKSRVWRLQGLLIYPLGAVGAILVFLATERDRTSLPLEMKKAGVEKALAALEAERPPTTTPGLWATSAPALFGMIDALKGLGDACNQIADISAKCIVSGNSTKGLALAQAALANSKNEPDTDRQLIVLCDSFAPVVEKLKSDDALDDDIARQVVDTFRTGFNAAAGYRDDPTLGLADDFQREALAKIEDTFSRLSAEYEIVRNINEEQVALGRAVLVGYSACFSAPDAVKAGTLKAWLDHVAKQKEASVQTTRDLAKIKFDETRAQAAKYVQLQLWPYALIVIFALQFGKAVSEVRARAASNAGANEASNTDASTVLSVSSGDSGSPPGTRGPR